ncbi:hypothetical protein ACFWBF_24450 [Streptomyces sp. NPDC060028]|uniref:hypothetical protein n=1 Tax=Streptomyces sp. NPDC060028 TaxID=3347041 RepID=UPI0036AD9B7D
MAVDDQGLPARDTRQQQDVHELKLGAFIANCRTKRTSLSDNCITQLDTIAMRWP